MTALDQVVTGTWTDPRDGQTYEETFDAQRAKEYREWIAGFIAAIRVGIYDEWTYDIAAACYERHLATDGQASQSRPISPLAGIAPVQLPVDPLLIASKDILNTEGISAISSSVASRTPRVLKFRGGFYPWSRIAGKYFVAPSNFNTALHGVWLRIEGYDDTTFQCRIVTEPAGPGVRLGQTILVEFTDVRYLFDQ